MGFQYKYRNMMVYSHRGYKFRKTQILGPDGRHVYQINDEPIDAPLSKRELTTMKKVHEYIDKRIEDRERIMAQIKDIAAENKDYRIWVENDGTDCHLHIDIKL